MNIGILTLSASDNCGSLLQTYALQEYLIAEGHQVEVINFVNKSARKMYRLFHPGYIRNPKKFFGQFIRIKSLINQKKSYDDFRKQIHLTRELYTNAEELKKLDGKFDVIIVGSDQVWSVNMGDFDTAYFLEWCVKSKKVSYAASLGRKNENTFKVFNEKKNIFKEFTAISVREHSSKKILENIIDRNITETLDPTLLLDQSIWNKIVDNSILLPKSDFIFYYSYNYTNEQKNLMVKKFAEENGLQVFVINASRWVDGKDKRYGFKRLKEDGPTAFLALMANCKFSFVESFHGIIFSNIFHKDFWYVEDRNVNKLDDRIEAILKILDKEDRIMYTDQIWNSNFEVNYNNFENIISERKNISERFLKEL